MNFEHSIEPLTGLLAEQDFSVSEQGNCYVCYANQSAVIKIAYNESEELFSVWIGTNTTTLVELTPNMIQDLFNGDRFYLQQTLTVADLILFFQTTGKVILSGDKKIFREISEYAERTAKEYTGQLIQSQYLKAADEAWVQENYAAFIEHVDRTEKDLLPRSYLKKYTIAINRLHGKTK